MDTGHWSAGRTDICLGASVSQVMAWIVAESAPSGGNNGPGRAAKRKQFLVWGFRGLRQGHGSQKPEAQ